MKLNPLIIMGEGGGGGGGGGGGYFLGLVRVLELKTDNRLKLR